MGTSKDILIDKINEIQSTLNGIRNKLLDCIRILNKENINSDDINIVIDKLKKLL